ncbi:MULTISPECIES: DNA primase [Micromonospora]|uniref:DNA primase n=1 Tax=Micromonospora solifontis TaxID=2487138 RepID=A0ABX9WNI8_9ACTN|nr:MULTISPECIES: DNA primase [Micromonospora]NES14275.1 DNA primase [Micromonospora sp. PPF5-17B]NES34988.1 DNA primase [Micromonospora solifontis]NES55776.1 DNA primase [Micromonospora sp. PPF5-6]RNM01261.1 DNA primase [Micromonospora solifontis]
MGNRQHTEVSVARQSPQRPDADEPELDDTTASNADDEVEASRPAADRALWDELRIDPVEIALPAGTGFTLRAYRPARELAPTDVADRDQDDPFLARRQVVETEDDEEVVILDEEFAALTAEEEDEDEDERPARRRRGKTDVTDEAADADEDEANEADEDEADEDDEDEDEADDAAGDEEVPAFLTHRGKLLLFKTPESLVSFVRSGAPNDLSQLDSWNELSERVEPADIAPLDEDTYELDLVVENLRGGHDAWDPTLLIEAGEVARDLAYALRLPAVLDMLSAGSSLDDLDEALRASVNGGIGGFLGRRRLKKIGAQTASLGWRTIVGKISAVVDWRD